MQLSDRDRHLVEFIAGAGQASAAQVAALWFPGLTPARPNHRLRRLTELGYLARLPRRLHTTHSGSGQYVYCLGAIGRELYSPRGSIFRVPSVNEHSLGVVDVLITVVGKQRAGELELLAYKFEPDCHVQVGSVRLEPDFLLDLSVDGVRRPYWIELERTIRSSQRISEKLQRYWRAYQEADAERWPTWPRVIFIAAAAVEPDKLKREVAKLPEHQRDLFRVATMETLAAAKL